MYELKDLPVGDMGEKIGDIDHTFHNLFHLSTVKITDLDVAFNYSNLGHLRKKFTPSGVVLSERDVNLFNDNFPVIYGLRPKTGRKINPTAPDYSLGGEGFNVDVQIVGGADFDEIVSIFVPANKVKLVQEMIADLNLSHTIKVSPIEPIQEAFDKNI